jgi:hypothetical protein
MNYTVYCFLEGESTSESFPVEISSDKTVGEFKDAIKLKRHNTLHAVDASKLTLWVVEISLTPTRPMTLSLPDEEVILSNLDLDVGQQETIAKCRGGNEPIHLSRLSLREDQKAAITKFCLGGNEVANVKYLADPSMTVSDGDAFGTGPLPKRKIHIIIQLPATHCLVQAFQRTLSSSLHHLRHSCL